MQCDRCGYVNPEGNRFCAQCGRKIKQAGKSGFFQKKILIAAIFCVVIVALVGFWFSAYNSAVSEMESQNFAAAQQHFRKIPLAAVLFSEECAYVDAGVLMEEGSCLDALKVFDRLEEITVPAQLIEKASRDVVKTGDHWKLKEVSDNLQNITIPDSVEATMLSEIYSDGQAAYRAGKLSQAEEYFSAIGTYNRSKDYLALISYKNKPKASDYNTLLRLIEFEDSAELMIENYGFALDFLTGTWRTEQNYYLFQMKQEDGGFSCTYTLPHKYASGYFYFTNGVYSVGKTATETVDTFKISIIDSNTIDVYCYVNDTYYTLCRQ